MFFSSWQSLLRVLAVGLPAFISLVILLRIGGKRTLSKFNAFDMVITVAFGSTLSAGLLTRDVALTDIVAAFALLVGLQFVITFSMMHWPVLEGVFKNQPRIVFRRGEYVTHAMRAERLTTREVEAAIRSANVGGFDRVYAVILEPDGSLSVVLDAKSLGALPEGEEG